MVKRDILKVRGIFLANSDFYSPYISWHWGAQDDGSYDSRTGKSHKDKHDHQIGY